MSIAKKEKTFSVSCPNLESVVKDVAATYRARRYEVAAEQKAVGSWYISLHQGGIFKTVTGLKTSLNVEMEQSSGGITVKETVGIFGEQAIPTAISMLVFWPVLITQIWGLVEQEKLDEEVLDTVGKSLARHAAQPEQIFCVHCGSPIPQNSKFCLQCGAKIE